jgi:hypothetical protein
MTEKQNKMLVETHTLTTQVHEAMFGKNGTVGMKAEMDRLKGGYAMIRILCIAAISTSAFFTSLAGIVVAIVIW